MQSFTELFNEENIILYLCKLRAKQARSRNKKHNLHLLTNSEKYNYHKKNSQKRTDYEIEFSLLLESLMPKRRQWKKLGKAFRYKFHDENKHRINSVDYNVYSLVKTIKYYNSNHKQEPFLVRLHAFIKEIQVTVQDKNFEFNKPIIYPQPKLLVPQGKLAAGEHNICRPIALFSLRDKLILSFTNKYLTKLFDSYFEDCSLAFRSSRFVDNHKISPSHHDAIQKILEYRNIHLDKPLWVAECDMKKFYDSVNHEIVLDKFDKLLSQSKINNPTLDFSIPEIIFKKYLNCYCFKEDVLPLNNNSSYWSTHRIPAGKFDWIESELLSQGYYRRKLTFSKRIISDLLNTITCLVKNTQSYSKARIGVPQGGALSGLIANILLDYSDKCIKNADGLFYIRFCDDMIMMHPDKEKCKQNIDLYSASLNTLKLAPHKFATDSQLSEAKLGSTTLSLKPFWATKSKGPYKWDLFKNSGYPWIGFVGYEIHCTGAVRIRKSSFKKEIAKQQKVIETLKRTIRHDARATHAEIVKSANLRLIGMSVGRINLWNYQNAANEMCWHKGFTQLNKNKYVLKQIKSLDRSRNKLISGLTIYLNKTLKTNPKSNLKSTKQFIPLNYNKPFSYYYQVIEKHDHA